MRSCRQTNADPAAVKNAVDVTLNSFGGLDILVNKSEIHIGELHQVQHLAADGKYLAGLGNAVLHPAGSRSLERTLIQIGLDSRDRCLSSLAARHCSSLLCFGHLDRRVWRCDLRLSRTDCGFTAACRGTVNRPRFAVRLPFVLSVFPCDQDVACVPSLRVDPPTRQLLRRPCRSFARPLSMLCVRFCELRLQGSFKFINAKGEDHYVRYQLVPEAGEQLLTDAEREKQSANYLMAEIKARVAAAPIGFALYAQVAEHGDRINDPSIAWPGNRKRVLLGRLEIKRLTANTAEEDRRLVFNPSNVPTGIETADMLSSFYSKAFRLSAEQARDVAPVARN